MASTPADRLHEAQRTYRDAYSNRNKDRKDATSMADVRAIERNLDAAEAAFNRAGVAVLEQTGASVERAYRAARDANDAIDQARANAVALADRIRAVAAAITKVNELVVAAKKKI